jgi:hypothetical protein
LLRKLRFSIATLLLLTLVSAVLTKWLFPPKNAILEGEREWTRMGILSHSIALVDASFPDDRWHVCAVASGDGHYCHISKGSHILNTTGGWYYSIGIQLPHPLSEGWTTELRTIPDPPNGNVRKLALGEIVALEFGNPRAYALVSGGDESLGTLNIVKVSDTHATIKVTAQIPLRGTHNDHKLELEIDEEFELDIVLPNDFSAQIPYSSRIVPP